MFRLNKKYIVILHDYLVCTFAWMSSWWIRFNFDIPEYYLSIALYSLPLILLIQGLVFWRFSLYRGIWRFASLPDLWNIFRAAVFGALCITLVLFIAIRLQGVPRSILVLYPIFLIYLLGAPRLGYRAWKDHSFNFKSISKGQRVLIIGAGSAGEMLVRDMIREGNYLPVGFIDDNSNLKDSEIHGVRVLGNIFELNEISKRHHVEIIIIAVPSASNEEMQKIITHCEKTDCEMRTLPRLQDMVSGRVTINQLREVSIEDLLGREKVDLDWKIIQEGINDKVVLVTGAGGSIGTELCLQISQLNPAMIIVFERSEFNLYKAEKALSDLNNRLDIKFVLGDLCDKQKVDNILNLYKPDIIFHAAAYKHVPILQNQVREAVKNNILATRNLSEAAIKYNCNKFVFISTDKAVNPVNVLGATKRISEIYCEYKNRKSTTRFITVRFGNVLDSDGSVIPLFKEQIKKGGPVTVTHPEITRFFMTIPEACQLILQAASMGSGGEIYILDMGKPVNITYLAEQMIKLSGREPGVDIEITYTGLRPGEKLYEELFYENENKDTTPHPKILLARHSKFDCPDFELKINQLDKYCDAFDENNLKELMNEMVPSQNREILNGENVVSIDKGRK